MSPFHLPRELAFPPPLDIRIRKARTTFNSSYITGEEKKTDGSLGLLWLPSTNNIHGSSYTLQCGVEGARITYSSRLFIWHFAIRFTRRRSVNAC